jgi:EmrB/QacA subfamily drug resistance transporter
MRGNGTAERRQLALTLLVAGTFFMENLDGTILATAAPRMATDLGVNSAAISVAITSYLLTLAILIPLSGWLTERFGARLIFPTAIAVFTVASVLCALSSNLPELVIMRVLQGVGGAMMVPVGRLVVLRATEKKELIRAIAWLTWPALAAPVIAPLAGGFITTYASWHWIFLINVPLGVVAFIAAIRLVPHEKRTMPERLDWLGLVLTCGGIGALIYLGSEVSGAAPSVIVVIVSAVVGFGLSGLAVHHLLRAKHPLLQLRALRVQTFRVTHAGGSLFRLSITAVPFLLPLLFQDALGWSPVQSGALVLFVFVGNLAIKPLTTPMLVRFGFRTVLLASSFAAAASIALVALVGGSTSLVLIAALLTFSGIARSVGFTAYNTIAFADIKQESMTEANTLASTIQQVAAGFGVAVGAVALSAGQAIYGSQAGLAPYRFAFVALAVLTLGATIEAWFISKDAADNLRPARVPRARSTPSR